MRLFRSSVKLLIGLRDMAELLLCVNFQLKKFAVKATKPAAVIASENHNVVQQGGGWSRGRFGAFWFETVFNGEFFKWRNKIVVAALIKDRCFLDLSVFFDGVPAVDVNLSFR